MGRGGTIIPIILSSDKTQLTLFRNKSAYPLYLTIGNIPKEIRRRPSYRAYVLLAYLPTSNFAHIPNKAARRRCVINVYHSCMSQILEPLKTEATQKGIQLANAHGDVYQGHPIYACFIGDYPEQIQAACCITGDCPKCLTTRPNLGLFDATLAIEPNLRSLEGLLRVLENADKDPLAYRELANELRVKPVVEPFWKGLPHANIYKSITPDVLHQLYQGVVKHLVAWITQACGAAEIDARCRRLPPNHNIHTFLKGITTLSRVSGKEHAQMAQILLGLVVDIRLPNGVSNVPFQKAIRAVLDFLYLAQYPVHTTDTLNAMTDALSSFHENKHVFVALGIRDNFNLPKLHFASHYVHSIITFGTTDNFNTEYTERLHIDLAKDAYHATNHKDEYTQMARWLERKEKMARYGQYIAWRANRHGTTQPGPQAGSNIPGLDFRRFLKVAKAPTRGSTSLDIIQSPAGYGAIHFLPALSRFIALVNNPDLTRAQLDRIVNNTFLPTRRLPVWHLVKFQREDFLTGKMSTVDIIHAYPVTEDRQRRAVPARFDTVLINEGSGDEAGVYGRRVGRVRVVFGLPDGVSRSLFRDPASVPAQLAYVEWFSPFAARPDRVHGLYKVAKSLSADGSPLAEIIPLSYIYRSVHLFPKFGPSAPTTWTSSSVLDHCSTFFLNPFTDRYLYAELRHP